MSKYCCECKHFDYCEFHNFDDDCACDDSEPITDPSETGSSNDKNNGKEQ